MTLASMAIAQGAELKFKPDPSNPFFNKFENKTHPTGYCLYYPSKCQATNMFSLRTPIAFDSKHPIVAKHTDPRQGAIFYIPTEWRDFMVTHSQTGAQETVRVRIVGFGSQYLVAPDDIRLLVNGGLPGIDIGPAHRMMWGGGYHGTHHLEIVQATAIPCLTTILTLRSSGQHLHRHLVKSRHNSTSLNFATTIWTLPMNYKRPTH